MKNKKRKNTRRNKTLIVLVVVCIALVAAIAALAVKITTRNSDSPARESISIVSDSQSSETGENSDEVAPAQEVTPEPLKPVTLISPDVILSGYGYMERVSDGSMVLDKNSTQAVYPASMTKVMSVLIAIENLPDLDEQVQVSTDTIAYCLDQHASMAGFAEGEWVTVRDLLYGAMLPSGGDAVITLANRVAGSETAFADMMNAKAAEMGLTGTHFVNSTGLHDDNQYTTCADMAVIFNTALQNPTFYEIVTSATHQCAATDAHPDGLIVGSTVFSHLATTTMDNGAVILGGKTGTTDEAGNCLVSFGEYDSQRYILVTALGSISEDGVQNNFADAVTAYSSLQ